MKKLLFFSLLLSFCTIGAIAQDYNTANDGNWTTASNWSNVSGWGSATPASGHNSGTINVNNNMTYTGNYTESSSMTIAAGKTLTINGDFSTSGGGTITVNGNLVITGALSTSTTFIVAAGGSVTVNGAVTHNGGANLTINGNFNAKSTMNVTGSTLNLNAGANLTVSNTFTSTSTVNVYGTFAAKGAVSLLSNPLNIYPGGGMTIDGSLTSNTTITVGTNVAPPAYADFVVKGDIGYSSNPIVFNRNARVGIFGGVTVSSWTNFTVNDGAQVYVNQNISLPSGGNVVNNNTVNPFGLYVNGSISNVPSGTTTTNQANKAYMEANNIPFTTWLNTIPNTPLPITLAKFTGKILSNGGGVELYWLTLSETNNKYFTIWSSKDAKEWTVIAEIAGAGNSSKSLNYNYKDNNLAVNNYYRLQQTDHDGKSTLSGIIHINKLSSASAIKLFPNPSQAQLYIQHEGIATEIIIYDVQGKEHYRKNTDESIFQTQINIADFPKGTYFVKFSDASIPSQRFTKN